MSFEILAILLRAISEGALGELLNQDLMGFLKFSIEKSNYARAAILALAEVTKRSSELRNYRDFVVFNGLAMAVDKALRES